MRFSCATDKGPVRELNEDSYAYGSLPGGASYAVVSDGMGGHSGGEIASAIAVERIVEALKDGYEPSMNGRSIRLLLLQSIDRANEAIISAVSLEPSLEGMGATVVVSLITEDTVFTAHIGDSRAYHYTGGVLTQITNDHSLVQELVDAGELTREQARLHPHRNLITRALGAENEANPDFNDVNMSAAFITPRDKLLLCTDGLSGELSDDELSGLLDCDFDDNTAQRLVEASLLKGGHDNVTVVVIADDSEDSNG